MKRTANGHQRSPTDYLDGAPRQLYRFQPADGWITREQRPLSKTVLVDEHPSGLQHPAQLIQGGLPIRDQVENVGCDAPLGT